MSGFSHQSLESPDETRTPPKTRIDVVRPAGTTAGRFTFQPAWRWSEAIEPVVGDESVVVLEFESAKTYAEG